MPTAEDLLPPSIGTPGGLLTEVCDALDAELAALSDESWALPVIFDWTVRDVVAHLVAVNEVLVARLRANDLTPLDAAELAELDASARRTMCDLTPDHVVDRWRASVDDLIKAADADQRVGWVGLTVPACLALVDRAFETWIHANDIRHAINRASLDPSAQSFRVLSDLAAKLLPMAWSTAGHEHPACVQLVLSGAGGGEWTLALAGGGESATQVQLTAAARDLCLLMGDRVDPLDFAYTVRGDDGAADIAGALIAVAPTFARP
jgi:uncharacterized protein (TIGR03083 family)